MRELERPRHIAAGQDVGERGLQMFVHRHGAPGGVDAQRFQAEPLQAGAAAHGAQDAVEGDAVLYAFVLGDQVPRKRGRSRRSVVRRGHLAAHRPVSRQHGHIVRLQTAPGVQGGVFVLLRQQARAHLHQRDLRAQTGKGLGQLAADGAAAQHQQARRQFAQAPERVAGQHTGLLQAGQRRDERARARGDDDGARGQRLSLAVGLRDFHMPRVDDARPAQLHIHAQATVAIHRVVRLDVAHHLRDTCHHGGEVHRHIGWRNPHTIPVRLSDLLRQRGRANQGLAGHAAGVQAVTAHAVGFHQGDAGFDGRGDVARHQPGGACADDHQVAIKAPRAQMTPGGQRAAGLQRRHQPAPGQRQHPQQRKGPQQRG